jgi:hypothetical protein
VAEIFHSCFGILLSFLLDSDQSDGQVLAAGGVTRDFL